MQVVVQKWIDLFIFKIINCLEDISFDVFKDVYMQVWDIGCKGCIIYCLNDIIGFVLIVSESEEKVLGESFVDYVVDIGEVIYMFELLECL